IINEQWFGSASMIHFGFDESPENCQKELHFYNNTVVNINDWDEGGRWYTYVFKCENDNQTVWAANNIFHSFAPDPDHWSGDFYMMSGGGGKLAFGMNWVPTWVKWGVTYMVKGEENLIYGDDPGFIDQNNYDFRLSEDSPCLVGEGVANYTRSSIFVPMAVEYEFDYETGTWVLKDKHCALGALG